MLRSVTDWETERQRSSASCVWVWRGSLVVTSCSFPTKRLCARFDYGIYLDCRLLDSQTYNGTPSGVHETELVLSIRGFPWSPDGERAGVVNIGVDFPETGSDRDAYPSDIGLSIIPRRSHRPMFGLLCRSTGNWVPDKSHWTMSRKDWAGAWRGVWRNFQGRSRQRELNESDTRSEPETWELGSVIKV